VFLLLDVLDGTVLEGESIDVGFVGSALDDFRLGESGRPFGESTELDQGLRGEGKGVSDDNRELKGVWQDLTQTSEKLPLMTALSRTWVEVGTDIVVGCAGNVVDRNVVGEVTPRCL
jgi:hypothetical protein